MKDFKFLLGWLILPHYYVLSLLPLPSDCLPAIIMTASSSEREFKSEFRLWSRNWTQAQLALMLDDRWVSARHGNGSRSVADPRALLATNDRLVCRIFAEEGTWHRPFTTLELAALQSIYDPDDYSEAEERGEVFLMDGTSDSAHRERIGNAVPRKAAKAMAEEIGRAILLSRAGESFQLSSTPIWVRPLVMALAVREEV